MKTHILQLEQHDDMLSVRDKLGWCQGGRILVVWPDHGRVLHRRLDLVLLQRQSAALGAQLALVTRDPDVHYYAPRLGIPVFKKLRQAQSAPWRTPRRFRKSETQAAEGPSPSASLVAKAPVARPLPPRPLSTSATLNPLARLAVFTLGVLAVLAIAAALLPGAEITLTPERQTQQITLEIQASPEGQAVLLSGALPARSVSVVVEGRQSQAVSGSTLIPDRPASVELLFTNLTDQAVTIPAGTVVRDQAAQALRFEVTQGGRVPAGPGESLSLEAQCLTLGSSGNLPANSLTAIEGPLGTQLSAANPLPARNGSDRKEPAPTSADRQALAASLQLALRQTALGELQSGLAEGDLLLEDSLSLSQILETVYQPAETQPTDQLSLNLRAEFQALVVSGEDLRTLAQAVLDASLPPGYRALETPADAPRLADAPRPLEIEHLTTPSLQGGMARWKMRAGRQIQAQLSQAQAIQLALGLAPEQASARLAAALPLAAPPAISLTPGWWPRLPILPLRISIQEPGP